VLPENIAYVPEDRHRDALVLDFTVTENIALKGARTHRGVMPWRALRQRAATTVAAFDVRGATPLTPVRQLSGGNQQKLVLGRELEGQPTLVVAINPTRGLDIRATAAVHERLRATRGAGAAVIFYSSDLDELLEIATRLFVVHGGIVTETPLDRTAAGAVMLGVT
jgi:simple sugar transport system ATP-binding protein